MISKSNWHRNLFSLLGGASVTFAFAPFNVWPITVLALAFAIRQVALVTGNGWWTAYSFGFGLFAAGISWVHVSIADFGGMPLLASLALMALLSSYLALFPALALYLCKRYFSFAVWPLVLPLLWFISEWLRSWLLTGFPWLSIGYSQLASPLSGWLPVVGETGVTALVVMLAALLAQLHSRRTALSVALMITVMFVSGFVLNTVHWAQRTQAYHIAMVQGNIAQSLRWTPEQDRPTMDKYLNLTEPLWQNDLIIWPEAAVPKLESLAGSYLYHIDQRAANNNTALITGIVDYDFEGDKAWNNLIVLGQREADQKHIPYRYKHTNRYAKHHLLPVGEFVPFEDLLRPLAPLFDLPMSSFSRGNFEQANLLANGIKLAPALCFEIAFPRQISANLNADTDMIITVSNDAWFGDSHGPAQHMQIAQVRAKEFAKPVLRATNNGITAFVDEHGDVITQLPQFESGSISAQVWATRGFTPYARLGDILPFTLLLLLVALNYKKIAISHLKK